MILGIDLGTTNSLVAVWRKDKPVLIPNALGEVITPSAVSVSDSGEILVGRAARERLATHPQMSAAAFKRSMGTAKDFIVGEQIFLAEELAAMVLKSLKEDAAAYLGEPVKQAVITVPAFFNDLQRKATVAAGEIAGLDVVRLLTEPTAAALAYGVQERAGEQTMLVADLGGGTFDVSLLHSFEGVMEVRATAGDIWLGGEDFVDVIAAGFLREAGLRAGMPASGLAPVLGQLRRQAENAMHRLSEADSAEITVVHDSKAITWNLSRTAFEEMAAPIMARIRQPIERALSDARVRPNDITQVVLAGGASRLPMFRRLIGRLFRRVPSFGISPDEVVVRGAAVRAGMQERAVGLDELVMTDVCPFTLGVEVSTQVPGGGRIGGMFSPIIERNTVVPVSRVQSYFTVRDFQDTLELKIYQGESRLVKENLLLGALTVPVPKLPAGQARVDVRFTHDSSGLLEVETTTAVTGARQRLVIEGHPGRLTPAEIEDLLERLASLKVSPRDQAENVALLAQADQLFQHLLGQERALLGERLAAFAGALDGQDMEMIAHTREMLRRMMDAQEGPWLS